MDLISAFDTALPGAAGTTFQQALHWLERSPACVVLLAGSEYECLYANPAGVRLAGRPVSGAMLFDILPELEEQGGRALLERVAARGRPFAGRARKLGLRRGGVLEWRLVDLVLLPLPGVAGTRPGLLVQCCDAARPRRSVPGTLAVAGHDPLTGLAGYDGFRDALERALAAPPDAPQRMAVALDINRFHRVNACVGRGSGDQVLRELAGRLSAAAGAGTTVARDGANRFLFLYGADDAQAPEALLGCFAAPFHADGPPLYLSASVGVVRFPADEPSADHVLASLEHALVEAQRAGPGAVRTGGPVGERERERARMSLALRQAIDGHGIAVHYQPQVDLASGRISGVEALVRWQHPVLGAVPADTIVRVAEESGLIGLLGERVLRQACTQAQAWRAMGFRDLRVAVNLSARQVQMAGLERTVLDALADSGLPPGCLDLELTESVAMDDVAQALACLQSLKRRGIQLSLDDFGTGHSSLACLRLFPIDTLKLDRSFLELVPGNARAAGLVKTIIASAHGLGIRVVAEGVEHEAQLAFLARSGCDEIQGYFFSRPLAPDQLTAMLLAGASLPARLRRHALRLPTILLVEGDPVRRRALGALAAQCLESGGRVLYGASAAEAIRMFEEAPDLIVIGTGLPDMRAKAILRSTRELCPEAGRILLADSRPLPGGLPTGLGPAETVVVWPGGHAALLAHMRAALGARGGTSVSAAASDAPARRGPPRA